MAPERLAVAAAAVASGTATDNALLRAVACEGLTHAELVEVQRVLDRSARLVMEYAALVYGSAERCGNLPVQGGAGPGV
jgi:hypothetical protein